MSLYYNPNGYSNVSAFFAALGQVPNFWDSTSADTLTKDGITVTLTSTTIITISGYGLSVTINTGGQAVMSYALIAATEAGLVFAFGNTSNITYCGALGVDDNGNWGAATGRLSTGSWTIDTVLADGVTSTTYTAGYTTSSDYNTQIVQLTSQHGNFIFTDLMRLLLTSQIGYRGKILLGDSEKYVLAGSFALKYTD